MYPIPLTIAGFIIFVAVDGFGPKYFSFFLVIFVFAMNSTLFTWIATSIPRPPAKRAPAIAIINGLGNSASIWTPSTYSSSEAPYYRTAFGISAGIKLLPQDKHCGCGFFWSARTSCWQDLKMGMQYCLSLNWTNCAN